MTLIYVHAQTDNSVKVFYIVIKSETTTQGKFFDFYNNCLKIHTKDDFWLADGLKAFTLTMQAY